MDLSFVLDIHRLDGVFAVKKIPIGDGLPVTFDVAVTDAGTGREPIVRPPQITDRSVVTPNGFQAP